MAMSRFRRMTAAWVGVGLAAASVVTGSAKEFPSTPARILTVTDTATSRIVFKCPKGLPLSVAFNTTDPTAPALVQTGDGAQISLPARESGSGFRYADDTHELRGKGREVTWTDGANPPVVCTEN